MRKRPRSATGDGASENELHPIGPTQIEVLADHLFEQHPAVDGLVQDLGEEEVAFQDGDLIAAADGAVLGGEGVRQAGQPLAAPGRRFSRR